MHITIYIARILKTKLLIAIAVCLFFSMPSFAGGVVIVHPSNNNTFDAKTISKIFLGKKKTYKNGNDAVPLDIRGGDPVRNSFVESVLKKNNQQIKAYWSQLLFTGKGRPPKEVSSSAAVKKLVSENPALIGYIDSASSDSSVKVVLEF